MNDIDIPTPRVDDSAPHAAGILDIVDNRAFLRVDGYLAGPRDLQVTPAMVGKHGLRRGDVITGRARPADKNPADNNPVGGNPADKNPARKNPKLAALAQVDTVNGQDPRQAAARPSFADLVPVYPHERLHLETGPADLTTRVIDILMPIGKGQRALVVAPPKAGKTSVLQAIAHGVAKNHPEIHLMTVLVGERPEEVTDFVRTASGEVIAATFDQPPREHTAIVELAVERAKRLVEQGKDVVILLDSLTRLGRAYNLAAPASGRILSGGVDAAALTPPKRFLGAARAIDNGGSLTIIASALVETGSAGDTLLFEEFKSTGNAELRLDRSIAAQRTYPAVDIDQSSTRRDDLLLPAAELGAVRALRRALTSRDRQQGIDALLNGLRGARTNAEFLGRLTATTPRGDLVAAAR
ncbi:MAG TPA: transcription termination factor Rho [Pseudonocardiaceae bacterium]|jgi:transcription termination factor Rho|nr:transcription termination factor Rho [Pseudonocardiaceae bacterium]